MKIKSLIAVLLCIVVCSSCEQPPVEAYVVLPQPQEINYVQGFVKLKDKPTVAYSNELSNEALLLASYLKNDFAVEANLQEGKDKGDIVLSLDSMVLPDKKGGYALEAAGSRITIKAPAPEGVFNGVQTLRQIIKEREGRLTVQKALVTDYPAFSWRAFMLDEGRYFKGKEVVLNMLDRMAELKMNVFHWHLTDDQGWRIEIKKYPKLTSIGGFRDKTIIGHAKNKPYKWEVERYGGFYTQEDIREIVTYAQKRFVEVIPEIEMPGHAVAALAAYPEYSCSGGPFEVEGRWGVFNDIFCTKEATFEFMQSILDEVATLFPSTYIHIGGDEAPRIRWKHCVHCQQRMKQENLTKEAELQTYFVNRIEGYLSSKGKRIIGWDEIIEGGIPHRATVMSWRGEKGGIHAAKAGYDVIMTPNNYLYLNHYQLDPKTEPLAIGGFTPLKKVYNYHPVPNVLTKEEAKHIKGVQGNLWTEYITSGKQVEYMVYPRAAALSEVAWSKKEGKDYENFYRRLLDIEKHYDMMNLNYCKTTYGK